MLKKLTKLFKCERVTPEEEKKAAILAATSWIRKNRNDLTPYLKSSLRGAIKGDGRYYVTVAVNNGKCLNLTFWVTLGIIGKVRFIRTLS
jgi:hypothetical protein